MRSFDIDGRVAETALDAAGLTVNKQVIPDDPRPPLRPSGIRLGTPALTTRGMREPQMTQVADWMVAGDAIARTRRLRALQRLREDVRTFPVPAERLARCSGRCDSKGACG